MGGVVEDLAGRELGPARRYGDRLRRCRGELGLSQRELAGRLGVDQKLVSRAERGDGSEEFLVRLERELGIPDDYPAAPKHPVRRLGWFAARNARLRPVPPASGTFGKGDPPKAA